MNMFHSVEMGENFMDLFFLFVLPADHNTFNIFRDLLKRIHSQTIES